MSKYKADITGINTSNLKALTNKENIELFNKLKEGKKEVKEKIINGNLKLVLSLINKYNNGKQDLNDLFQIGCVGLIKAVDNFSLDYNVQFSTYAVPLIIGEIKRFIRESSVVRISRSIKDTAYKILKYSEEYQNKFGLPPTHEEISKELNLSLYEISEALESLIEPASIYDPIYNDGGDTIYLEDQLSDPITSKPKDDTIALKEALTMINKRESSVLKQRYIYGLTQMEIADSLGVSQAQVSRIEQNALKNIKRLLK